MTKSISKFWATIFTFVPATALIFMDQTIMPVALPAIQREFSATDTQLQWMVNSYTLAIAMFLLISGKWSDCIGRRKMFCLGIIGFTLSSLLCGASTRVFELILARALQGFSAALMLPPQNAMMRELFPPTSLGRAIGVIVSIGSIFLMIAPVMGGYLTEEFSWRWIFGINIPIGSIGLWLVLSKWPSMTPVKNPIDLQGFFYFAGGVGLLTLFFMQVTNWGWGSLLSLSVITTSIFFLILLALREKWAQHPFLELSLFKKSLFAAINISVSTAQAFMMVGVFWLIYFQQTLHYTPIEAGFLSLVSGLPLLFSSPLAGYLSDRFGPKLPIALGYLCLLYTSFFLGFYPTPSLLGLLIAVFTFGTGIPLILTPSFSSALTSVPSTKTGLAMSTIITMRMVAGSVALACMHLLTSSVYANHLSISGEQEANIISFSKLHFALAFLIIISFVITFLLHTRKSAHKLPKSPGEGWD